MFPTMNVLATSDTADCTINTNSYTISSGSASAVTLSTSGVMAVDTSATLSSTKFKISVVVGSQTIESSEFSIEEYDCIPTTKFPNLKGEYVG